VQTGVVFNDPMANLKAAVGHLERLKSEGVDLVVFPEAFLTGYCVECQADACGIAIGVDHPALLGLREAADRLDLVVVAGFAEAVGDRVRNTAVLLEPDRDPRYYYKTHLPELGLDKFVDAGSALPVFETRLGRIALLICFDLRAPEPARALALQGAEIILLPTNWPVGAEVSADVLAIARAVENRVFLASCNRVGEENGFRFIGRSKIVHPTGKVLAAAEDDETTLIADVDLVEAREKRIVGIPGKYETTVFESRRPELYGELVRQNSG